MGLYHHKTHLMDAISRKFAFYVLFVTLLSHSGHSFSSLSSYSNNDLPAKSSLSMSRISVSPFQIMVNGMPGPMATEAAEACVRRGMQIVSTGFTGPLASSIKLSNGKEISLESGPGISATAVAQLKQLKKDHSELIVIDYTNPSAVESNVAAYVEAGVDFVMGTTGFDSSQILDIFNHGQNYAVIAPNMAKQIVALQYTLQEAANRFPGSFVGYDLKVTESHQSSKADTSGTAKALVSLFSKLIGKQFQTEDINMLRDKPSQLAFGVPEDAMAGHAFHTYQLQSKDGSVLFELKHNVCGRSIYAEGTADAVLFLNQIRSQRPNKRLYNMIDVLQSDSMK